MTGDDLMVRVNYRSPLGNIVIEADEEGITKVKFSEDTVSEAEANNLFIQQGIIWLDQYFMGQEPSELPPLHLIGTQFQERVWHQLQKLPYGTTVTYSQLAQGLRSSPRAVGRAVGQNHVLLMIPCHRVMGKDGSLTGYSGGIERKKLLLTFEAQQK